MVTFPVAPDPAKPIKTYVSEALHFRRGTRELEVGLLRDLLMFFLDREYEVSGYGVGNSDSSS
jgi:hypothetical protein